MLAANELKNLLSTSKKDKVLNHIITDIQLNVAYIQIFESVAHIHISKKKQIKSDIKYI